AKNRIHLDVAAGAHRGARVAELIAIGATHVRDVSENGGTWSVLLDPEGNEFCLTESAETTR
ncbi:MAG: VOC family protein, partial [Actinomycetota bacterium]|nr:VOC family protein [Actinomycetota bacterium]